MASFVLVNIAPIIIEMQIFSFNNKHSNMLSADWQPFCSCLNVLTHCGLVIPYGNIDLGQHWLMYLAWWHQAVTWTNVDLAALRSSTIHVLAISQEITLPSITKISLKNTYLKFTQISHGPMTLKSWFIRGSGFISLALGKSWLSQCLWSKAEGYAWNLLLPSRNKALQNKLCA